MLLMGIGWELCFKCCSIKKNILSPLNHPSLYQTSSHEFNLKDQTSVPFLNSLDLYETPLS